MWFMKLDFQGLLSHNFVWIKFCHVALVICIMHPMINNFQTLNFLVVSNWYYYFMANHSNGLIITLHVNHCKLICLLMTLNLVFLLVIEFLKILKVIEVKFLELKTQENCKRMRIWMRKGVVFLLCSSVRTVILSINFSLRIMWYWMEWTWQRERGSLVSRLNDDFKHRDDETEALFAVFWENYSYKRLKMLEINLKSWRELYSCVKVPKKSEE